jgi:hypothetical protein
MDNGLIVARVMPPRLHGSIGGCFRPEDPKRRSRDQVALEVKIVVGAWC